MKGKFITVEGVEGVGKSTNIAILCEMLREQGIDHLRTREPGGTPTAENIRSLLLDSADDDPAALAELLLIFAARADHVAKRIQPALEQGRWVICDRFTDASFAYQGAGRGLGRAMVADLQTMVQGNLRPDLTIIFDLPPEKGLARIRRHGALDRIENETIEFHRRVREGYLAIARAEPERCVVIDASRDAAGVGALLRRAVRDRLPELK